MRVEVCVGVLECAFRYYSCTLVVQAQKKKYGLCLVGSGAKNSNILIANYGVKQNQFIKLILKSLRYES